MGNDADAGNSGCWGRAVDVKSIVRRAARRGADWGPIRKVEATANGK